jgi:hypothetical protein
VILEPPVPSLETLIELLVETTFLHVGRELVFVDLTNLEGAGDLLEAHQEEVMEIA